MLSNISVNSLPFHRPTRPESATLPHKKLGSIINYIHTENTDSVFLSNDRIILPMKEYSNKFLRDHKLREDIIYNHSIIKPKKSLVYMRKQMKYRKNKCTKPIKDKENEVKFLKTECSDVSSINSNQSFAHSAACSYKKELIKEQCVKNSQAPIQKCSSIRSKMEKISTSRALQMFSKVFKNQNIERIKVKKQIINKTSDVHVKQVTLQDKEKAQKKPKVSILASTATNISTQTNPIHKKISLHPYSVTHKSHKPNKLLFMEDENFQLVGW